MKDLNIFFLVILKTAHYLVINTCVNGEEGAGTRWETQCHFLCRLSVTVVDFLFVQHKQGSSLNSSKYQTRHVNATVVVQLIVQKIKEQKLL